MPREVGGPWKSSTPTFSITEKPCFLGCTEVCNLAGCVQPVMMIALISDTGMRLSEAAGLLTEHIVLGQDIPHIRLRKHPWRSFRTVSSERDIQLAGASLWAAQRIIDAGSTFAPPNTAAKPSAMPIQIVLR